MRVLERGVVEREWSGVRERVGWQDFFFGIIFTGNYFRSRRSRNKLEFDAFWLSEGGSGVRIV
jgi:hypothetical protein